MHHTIDKAASKCEGKRRQDACAQAAGCSASLTLKYSREARSLAAHSRGTEARARACDHFDSVPKSANSCICVTRQVDSTI